MSSNNNVNSQSFSGNQNGSHRGNSCLVKQLCNHIGDTVTIFTTGGEEFKGVIEGVNNELVRLVTHKKEEHKPTCPDPCRQDPPARKKKTICDIQLDQVTAFCRTVDC